MKVEYDRETDSLTVTFRHGVVAESDEYGPAGNLLRIEVLDASSRGA